MNAPRRRFYIRTFGCQMNEYDSRLVKKLLLDRGFEEVSRPEEADIVLVNTCTVRERADRKALEFIHTQKKHGKRVLAMGCMAQWMGEELRHHGADWVVGTGSLALIPEILEGRSEEMRRVYCENLGQFPERQALEPGEPFAFLTIMRGCDHFCTFCIVPRVRGREVSRRHEEILQEARYLESLGVLELTLLGQNVNTYFDGDLDFAELLALLDRETRFLRIRFTSPHPRDITAKVLMVIRDGQRLTPWIHLPLQAGSTEVLRRMNRGYTKEEFVAKAHMIREVLGEDAAITTDIMVGFPGETDEDFEKTLDVVRAVQFDGAYMFIYSPRPGTPAARFPDQVPERVKGLRLRRLIEVVNQGILARRQRLVGRTVEVLVEKPARKSPGFSTGKTWENISAVVHGLYARGTLVRGVVREIRGLTPVVEVQEAIPPEELRARLGLAPATEGLPA